jgi:hypothetical protein
MNIISHKEFGKLKLNQFLNKKNITKLRNWRFMEDSWFGEAYIFTEFLRLYKSPFKTKTKTKSISLELDRLGESTANKIIQKLGLELEEGMTIQEISNQFKSPVFTCAQEDRISYEYIIGNKEKYYLSCTVFEKGGLNYIVMMNHKKSIRELQKNYKDGNY